MSTSDNGATTPAPTSPLTDAERADLNALAARLGATLPAGGAAYVGVHVLPGGCPPLVTVSVTSPAGRSSWANFCDHVHATAEGMTP